MPSNAMTMEIDREWAAACAVQRAFMPQAIPEIDTLSFSAHCRQLRELGGDCYDFVPLPGNRLAVSVGDASGKGLAAALMISSVQSSIRTAALLTGNDGAAVLDVVNRQVHSLALADRYATLFYGVFDGSTRRLHYVNAGHNPPMVLRRDGSIEWLETGGAPVGIFPDWSYEEGEVQLDSGDLLLAYTDGVTEAMNPAGDQWGVEALRRTVAETAAQTTADIVQAVFASIDEFSRGCQTDDATVVAMRVH
jgi:phosphoserine phosphatase RsbU/P